MKNHYQILGVEPGCSPAEIKKAYRLLAVQYHPDKNNGDSLSEERFKEISESYIILGDAVKRDAYDYACGYQKKYKAPTSASGHTPTGILLLFKKIKNKIFNSGGIVNEQLLYKLVTDLLTSDTIDFLIKAEEIANNSLIIDEVLVCGIFLSDEHKSVIAEKLTALANGNPRLLKKITVLHNKSCK
ncbi:DnaJ domain-containing protein [Flavobacterium sp. D11R37]|uniref:J domain-containing protein n=1 Tax=Flavobacterium coralii TaxID=2838017 RepID=UPI001CA640CD|nr:J domain-containing protein [Flavobacterium coralii]MBY8961558.1 DnaJ domain-containing protein [Flavobacterium coralii]